MSNCRDAALQYATEGWAVFPVALNKKTPLTKHGFKDATVDPDTLTRLFTEPCNLGLVTGTRSKVCVLDIDVRDGKPGRDTLHTWEQQYGALPPTRSATTWSGGQHYYFTCPVPLPSKTGLGAGIDFKADGGYVLAPPSTIEGKPYAWDDELPLAELPPWLLVKLTGRKLVLDAKGQLPPGTQDDQLHALACSLTKQGLAPEIVKAGLRTALLAAPQDPAHPFTEADLDRWMKGAAQFTPEAPPWSQFNIPMTGGKSQPICNADAALQILEHHPLFAETIWMDTFSNRILTTWEHPIPHEWQEADTQRLLIFLQRTMRLSKMAKSAVEDALGVFVLSKTRHAVNDWLKTLTWDGTPRIDRCLSAYFSAEETPYVYAASRNFWLSLIARVKHPGCQMDHMVILEGPQNLGKTKALRILGGSWYLSMAESVMEKDFFQSLQGKLIIEIAEMDSFRGFAEMNRIKQVLSTPIDHYRMPYGRRAVSYPRQCIFVGTTNERHYLRDPTGARRFWPIACGAIDIPALELAREQLFAEAAALFRPGITWWEMPEGVLEEQEARREEDAWEAPVHEYLLLHQEVTVKDVLCDALTVPLGQINRADTLRVASILRKQRWEKKRIRYGEKFLWKWVPPVREPGEDLQVQDFEV